MFWIFESPEPSGGNGVFAPHLTLKAPTNESSQRPSHANLFVGPGSGQHLDGRERGHDVDTDLLQRFALRLFREEVDDSTGE